ncbi:response regulator [bacterium]|nr:response regulator [bacterium]
MSKKIIVIDDSRSTRQALSLVLGDAHYQVVEAVDGEDGLSKIQGTADAALVICDVNMPKLNGLDMVEALRRVTVGKSLPPIVMLTTEVQADLVARAKAAGVKGWIVKPFKPDLLLLTVQKLTGV